MSSTMAQSNDSHSGNNALSVSERSGFWSGPKQVISLKKDVAYTISAWVKLAAGEDESIVKLKLEDTGASTEPAGEVKANASNWSQIIFQFTPDADAGAVSLVFHTLEAVSPWGGVTVSYLLDDVQVTYATEAENTTVNDSQNTTVNNSEATTTNAPTTALRNPPPRKSGTICCATRILRPL